MPTESTLFVVDVAMSRHWYNAATMTMIAVQDRDVIETKVNQNVDVKA